MGRRRLTAIAGALGLVAWLSSSAVGAQAATAPTPDLTYSTLLATYTALANNGGSACVGGTVSSGGSSTICTITQYPTGRNNVAVCVQNNSPTVVEECDITQTNSTRNNYALIIQRFVQNQGPDQRVEQHAFINQSNGSGSNFAGVFQTVRQSINSTDPQTQADIQELSPPNCCLPGLGQVSVTGSNFAAAVQSSSQSEQNSGSEDQYSNQFAGDTGKGDGINQNTAGANAAALIQFQSQTSDNTNTAAQNQSAFETGDITQNGAPGTNLASGTQLQNQIAHAVADGSIQMQIGDPKCCSLQTGGGRFTVRQATNQQANATLPNRTQKEDLVGNCQSPLTTESAAGCNVHQSATENTSTATNDCTGESCQIGVSCADGTCTSACTVMPVGEGGSLECVVPTPTPTPTPIISLSRSTPAASDPARLTANGSAGLSVPRFYLTT